MLYSIGFFSQVLSSRKGDFGEAKTKVSKNLIYRGLVLSIGLWQALDPTERTWIFSPFFGLWLIVIFILCSTNLCYVFCYNIKMTSHLSCTKHGIKFKYSSIFISQYFMLTSFQC